MLTLALHLATAITCIAAAAHALRLAAVCRRGRVGWLLLGLPPAALAVQRLSAWVRSGDAATHAGLWPVELAGLLLAVALLAGLRRVGARVRRLEHEHASLADSQHRHELLLSAAEIGLWTWDNQTRQLSLSSTWKRQLGYADHEIGDRFEEWHERLHPDDRARVDRKITAYLANPVGDYEVEFRLRHRNGDYRWFLSRAHGELDEDGRLRRMTGCHVDIDATKQAEARLEQERNLLRTVIDNVPDAIYVKDCDRRYVIVNRATLAALGARDQAAVLGRRVSEFLPAEPAERFEAEDREVLRTQAPIFVNEERRVPDVAGVDRWYWTTKAPLIDAEGRVTGLVGISRDVTQQRGVQAEREKLEARMHESQRLESLGVLAGGIAHDFNNLLTGVLGNASLALMALGPESPARRSVEQIEVAALRAADLCKQLLAYSGKGRFVVAPLNLAQLVEEMSSILSISISKKAVLKLDLDARLPAVEADATQIRQIVMNLITNASEAIGDRSGVISVSTGVMHCDTEYLAGTIRADQVVAGEFVFVEVTDNGCGMDAATRARIFDPFFSTKFTGRGLGLAAVLGIIRGHGGAIRVYSEPQRGSAFKVLLPASRAAAPPPAPPTPAASPWRGSGLVLVADDDAAIRTIARATLEQAGFEVCVAADGAEAIALFARESDRVRVVVLDMTMPVRAGEEVFREIRQRSPAVRVILSSGYNEQDATQRFCGKGLAGFLQKPYRAADLIARVRAALESGAGASTEQ